jgi:integrase
MPRLSDTKIRGSKPRAKPYKLYDADGLFVIVNPNGSKWWRQRYRYAGREQLLSLGVYGPISLSDARERGTEIRRLVAKGIDPSAHRKAKSAALIDAKANTLKAVALAWHAKFKPQWTAHHAHRVLQRLEDNVFPWLGGKAIRDVASADILACVDRMAQRGAYDTARRVLQILKKVFKWAIGRGLVPASPAAHIEPHEQLPSIDVRHRAAITDPVQLGALMRAIEGYQGGFVVRCGLKFIALTFVRPGELRNATWPEFQLDGKEPTWRIPAARMKMGGEDHVVPLSRQAVAVLRELEPLTGADGRGYVFPSIRNASRPISENTLNVALRTMGFTRQQHCSHGFRGTASTMLNEQQWNKDAIELQLAHMPRDKVRASYNAAAHLPLRRRMMQAWADYLDGLRSGGRVVPISAARSAKS